MGSGIDRAYGSWASPFSATQITQGSLRLSQPRLCQGHLHWLEGRPNEGGRQVVMGAAPGASGESRTPDGVSVRTRVHEYGGGDYIVDDGRIYYSSDADQRLYLLGQGDPLTDGSARYADLQVSPDGQWLVAVEERPREGREPANRLVAIPLPRGGTPISIASDFDFVSSPTFSPTGDRIAFLAWNHPNLPWDGTTLFEVAWEGRGPGARHRIAGGETESIFQPRYSPEGRLTYVSDRSGWWNLEQMRDGKRIALCPEPAEFGQPQWVFAQSSYDFIDENRILCVRGERGRARLAELSLESGTLRDLALAYDAYDGVRVEGGEAAMIVAGSETPPTVGRLDLATEKFRPVRSSLGQEPDSAFVSPSESWEFATSHGETAHAFLYRPRNPEFHSRNSRPPLLVKSHGGPTGATSSALNLGIQFWTSRGFAVVDVNYRGSTGFGRAYRDRLRGEWGILDVADCVNAARVLADDGIVDASRLAISGGSAGGYTTLCALTFHDVFGAGASHYGIGDLEALARDTHKFEARYLDGLIGPYPEARDLYVARSPIHHAERLGCPVIFFQGLEDRVVPPSQAEAMVAALAARGLPHAYVPFEGEQHGFRRAENQRTALEGELYFYSRVFGFDTDVAPPGVTIQGL